jgi:tripartite ATP-independent transporter DctM subunit
MEWYWALTLLLGVTILLMMMGVPVAFAFLGCDLVGAAIFLGGEAGLEQIPRNIVDALVNFALTPFVLFVLMGQVLYQTGVAVKAIDAIERLISRVPGRLSIAAVLGGVTFASISGSAMANAALLGTTLMPEMRRRGYHWSMSMGPIMGVGGCAMLIPPSNMAVLLGSISGISISALLIGGTVPGVLVGLGQLIYVVTRCTINPKLAPAYEIANLSMRERIVPFFVRVVPLLGLFVVVIGSILGGIATPTESAALGTIGAAVAVIAYRSFSWGAINRALFETGIITVMILFIVAASLTFSQILAFSGATTGLLNLVRGWDLAPIPLVLTMLGILLFLGCFMDSLSIVLITVPFFMPLAHYAGLDVIWFGILMLFAIEISGLTPPFGAMLFVMKSVAPVDVTMRTVYGAALPYLIIDLLLLLLLVLAPRITTWLPALLG